MNESWNKYNNHLSFFHISRCRHLYPFFFLSLPSPLSPVTCFVYKVLPITTNATDSCSTNCELIHSQVKVHLKIKSYVYLGARGNRSKSSRWHLIFTNISLKTSSIFTTCSKRYALSHLKTRGDTLKVYVNLSCLLISTTWTTICRISFINFIFVISIPIGTIKRIKSFFSLEIKFYNFELVENIFILMIQKCFFGNLMIEIFEYLEIWIFHDSKLWKFVRGWI